MQFGLTLEPVLMDTTSFQPVFNPPTPTQWIPLAQPHVMYDVVRTVCLNRLSALLYIRRNGIDKSRQQSICSLGSKLSTASKSPWESCLDVMPSAQSRSRSVTSSAAPGQPLFRDSAEATPGVVVTYSSHLLKSTPVLNVDRDHSNFF